jgi:hypothetical protein
MGRNGFDAACHSCGKIVEGQMAILGSGICMGCGVKIAPRITTWGEMKTKAENEERFSLSKERI